MATHAFLARQPIVDGTGQLHGYELLFRQAGDADSARIENEVEAGIQVIANTLFDMGTHWLLEGRLAFINMGPETLLSPTTTLLPPEKVVLELTERSQPTPEVLARIDELAALGYRFSMDALLPGCERERLVPRMAYVKINTQGIEADALRAFVQRLRAHPARLVAERVEDPEQYRLCQAAGFDYFQGYYFARPELLTARVINPSHAVVLQLLDKVRHNAPIGDIEPLFKKDVALTFKLLRYINSAGFGLSCEVQSIRHAVTILGMQPLYRWLTLLLATASSSPGNTVLARTAVARGRLCELLGGYIMDKADRDNLFITGVFSMLDALLETPMDAILERLVIPESIADALRDRSGIYGPILTLAEACERRDADDIALQAMALMLTSEQVNEAHLQSLAWVEQLGLD